MTVPDTVKEQLRESFSFYNITFGDISIGSSHPYASASRELERRLLFDLVTSASSGKILVPGASIQQSARFMSDPNRQYHLCCPISSIPLRFPTVI